MVMRLMCVAVNVRSCPKGRIYVNKYMHKAFKKIKKYTEMEGHAVECVCVCVCVCIEDKLAKMTALNTNFIASSVLLSPCIYQVGAPNPITETCSLH